MIALPNDEVAVEIFEATTEPIEVEAERTDEAVLALITEASEVEAVSIEALVLLLTAVVPAVIAEPSDDDADVTRLLVPVMREPIDVEAVPTVDVVLALIAV